MAIPSYESYTKQFKNPYNFSTGRANSGISQLWGQKLLDEQQEKTLEIKGRSGLDRTFDFLSTPISMVAGLVDGFVESAQTEEFDAFKPWQNAGKAFLHGINPFHNNASEKDEYNFSRVMETAGWKPTSTAGKVTKGVLGFGLDVALDPTTYLTGGVSAVVKGTGRVGKAAESVDKMNETYKAYKKLNITDELVEKGINPDLAKRTAEFKLSKLPTAEKATHMTSEMAEEFIKRRQFEMGKRIPDADIAGDAQRFADRYNQLIGIRDAKGAGDGITFGVRNLPFVGDKLGDKMGVFGKSIQLSDGARARALGDKLKISHAYSAARNAIYGSKIGELLSTNSKLYRYAKEDPNKLYQIMKFVDYTQGATKAKREADKLVYERARAMEFSPAESKEIIKLLEDKTVWSKVKNTVRFAETQKAKDLKATYAKHIKELREQTDTILKEREVVENLRYATDKELHIDKRILGDMETQLRDELTKIDLRAVKDDEELKKIMTAIREETSRIEDLVFTLTGKAGTGTATTSKALDELGNEVQGELSKRGARTTNAEVERMNLSEKEFPKNLDKSVVAREKEVERILNGRALSHDITAIRKELREKRAYGRLLAKDPNRIAPEELEKLNADIKTLDEHISYLKDYEKSLDPKIKRLETRERALREEYGYIDEFATRVPDTKELDELFEAAIKEDTEMMRQIELSKQATKELGDDAKNPWKRKAIKEEKGITGVTPRVAREKLLNHLSGYIYGEKGKIMHKLRGEPLKDLVDAVKRGDSPEEIRTLIIEKRPYMYSYHANEVYKMLGDKYGYDNWEEFFKKPMAELDHKYRTDGALSPQDEQKRLKLLNIHYQRESDINTYFKTMSYDDFRAWRLEQANKEMYQDLQRAIDYGYGKSIEEDRAKWLDGQSARDGSKSATTDNSNMLDPKKVVREAQNYMFEDSFTFFISMSKKNALKQGKNVDEVVNKNFENYIDGARKMTESMEAILMQKFPNKSYDELSSSQRAIVMNDAWKMMNGKDVRGFDQELLKSAGQIKNELERRAKVARIQTITDTVKPGMDIVWHSGKRPHVSKVLHAEETEMGMMYRVNVKGEAREVLARDVMEVYTKNRERMTPDELIYNTPTIQKTLARREELIVEMRHIIDEVTHLRAGKTQVREELLTNQMAVDGLKDIVKQGTKTERTIVRNSNDIETLKKREKAYKDATAKLEQATQERDALKALQSERDSDVRRLEELEGIIERGKVDVARFNQALEQVKDAQHKFRYFENIRAEKIRDTATLRENTIYEFNKRLGEQEGLIKNLEEKSKLYSDTLESMDDETLKVMQDEIKMYEDLLDDADAFEDFVRVKKGQEWMDTVLERENGTLHAMTALEDMTDSTVIRKWVDVLHREFERMGADEVQIGKLSREQFENMLGRYVPHILTPDGHKYFQSLEELAPHKGAISQDLGYGLKYNPYSQSRSIDGKNIMEINDYFRGKLKGKNLFSENISDIYLKRALKHNELMYDNKYMQTMMDVFGETVKTIDDVPEGFKAVMNYGHLRKHIQDSTKMRILRQNPALRSMKNAPPEMWEKAQKEVIEDLGLHPDILDDFGLPMVELTQGQLEKLAPTGLVKSISDGIVDKANQARKIRIERDQNDFLRLYDKFLHWTKLMQTTVMPSFHLRNAASNQYLMWLGIGKDAVNPKLISDAFKAAKQKGQGEMVRNLRPVMVMRDGVPKAMHWDEIYELAVQYNVVDEGFFAREMGAATASKGLLKRVPAKFDPTDSENFIGFKAGMAVGAQVENTSRLQMFASAMKQGMNPEEAAQVTTKYLFDYSDLTAFEQRVMKRLFPYYTWLRKNGRLQVSEIYDNTGKMRDVAKAYNAIDSMQNEEQQTDASFLSDFARDWVQMPWNDMRVDAQGNAQERPVLANPNLPFMDLGRLPNPLNMTSGEGVRNEVFGVLSQTAPLIKNPLEIASNTNFFFDSPITQEGENPISENLQHVMRQLAWFTAGQDLIKKEGSDKGYHVMNNLTGVKMLAYDYEMSMRMRLKEHYESLNGKEE